MPSDTNKHFLVPKHSKASDAEVKKILEKFSINSVDLPKILKDDPAVAKLNLKSGDVVKIERDSKTAGQTIYYRVVIDG